MTAAKLLVLEFSELGRLISTGKDFYEQLQRERKGISVEVGEPYPDEREALICITCKWSLS